MHHKAAGENKQNKNETGNGGATSHVSEVGHPREQFVFPEAPKVFSEKTHIDTAVPRAGEQPRLCQVSLSEITGCSDVA